MKKIITVFIITIVICIMVIGCGDKEPTPVQESEETSIFEVSGTLVRTGEIHDPERIENGKRLYRGTVYHDYHGTLEGKVMIHFTSELNLDKGIIVFKGEGTFTGTVNGKEGSFNFTDSTSGQMVWPDTGEVKGEYAIISSSGDLSNLGGVIYVTTTNFNRVVGTYSGMLSFGKETETTTTLAPTAAPATYQTSHPVPGPDSLVLSSGRFLWGGHQAGEIRLAPNETFTVNLANYRDNTEFRTWQRKPGIFNEGVVEEVDFRSYQVDSTRWHTWSFQALKQGACLLNFKTELYGVDVKEWTFTVSVDVVPPSYETFSVEFTPVQTSIKNLNQVWEGSVLNRKINQTYELSGDLKGTWKRVNTFQFDRSTRRSWSDMEQIFTGTVNGKSGTFVCRGFASGIFYLSGKTPSDGWQMHVWVITGGTGELANLHGTFTRGVGATPVEPPTNPPTYEYAGPFSGTFWFYE